MRTASTGAAAVSILRFCRARNGIVQERIPALRYIKAAALHIVACRRLEAHCLELCLHPADYKHRKADAHQNRDHNPNYRKRSFGQIALVVGLSLS